MIQQWKLAVVVRSDLEMWQKLNVSAFVSSGLGTTNPDLIGGPYFDASGQEYPPMLALPIRVFGGDEAQLRRAFNRGLSRDVLVSVYTDEMFSTMNDADNRAAVGSVSSDGLSIAGFAIAGEAKQVDKVFDKLKPHP